MLIIDIANVANYTINVMFKHLKCAFYYLFLLKKTYY